MTRVLARTLCQVGEVAEPEGGVGARDPLIVLKVAAAGRIKDLTAVGEQECVVKEVMRALEKRPPDHTVARGLGVG